LKNIWEVRNTCEVIADENIGTYWYVGPSNSRICCLTMDVHWLVVSRPLLKPTSSMQLSTSQIIFAKCGCENTYGINSIYEYFWTHKRKIICPVKNNTFVTLNNIKAFLGATKSVLINRGNNCWNIAVYANKLLATKEIHLPVSWIFPLSSSSALLKQFKLKCN